MAVSMMADQSEILSTVDDTTFENDDLGLIADDLSTCTAKWKTISIRLGLPMDKISTIERNGHSAEDCWEEALILWLGQNYNTAKYPLPSWRSLLKVIAKIDFKLFKKLAAEHRAQGDVKAPASKSTASGGGGGAAASGSRKDKMSERITNMRQLTLLECTKNGKKETINVISRAAHTWTRVADLIADDLHVIDNLRDLHRGKNEEAFKQLLRDYFIGDRPASFGGYTQDWNGLVKLLNDARLGTLASDVEEAVKSRSSQ